MGFYNPILGVVGEGGGWFSGFRRHIGEIGLPGRAWPGQETKKGILDEEEESMGNCGRM